MYNEKEKTYHYEIKIRSIKQDVYTEYCQNFESFKKRVLYYGSIEDVKFWQNQFLPRLREGAVYTKVVEKSYDVVCSKVLVDDTTECMEGFPFGF